VVARSRLPNLSRGTGLVNAMRVAAVAATALAALPLVYLVIRATDRGWEGARATLVRPRTVELTIRSLELAAIVTVLTLAIGLSLAWLVTRTDLPLRRAVQVAAGLPLALPSFVSAWSWIGFRPGLAGRSGAVLVLTSISYPYVYLPAMAALRRCDPALEDTARSLGHGRWSVFRRVTFPQVRPAAVGGGLLVGLYVLSDFGAVATMRYQVLTHAIYTSYRASFDRTPAAVLGCVLAALTLLIVMAEHRTRRHHLVARVGGGATRSQPVVHLGPWRWPLLAVPATVVGVSLGVPAWGMFRWFSRGSSRADPAELWTAVGNTLQVSALAAVAVVALVTPVAVLSVRHPGPLARTAERAAYAGHALPGVVIGLSLVFFGIRVVPSLYQRLPLLVVAYVVLFMSLGLGAIQAAVAQVPPSLEDVARTLGRGPMRAWTTVTLRLSAPGLGAAATLVFLTAMKELPAALFLRPTGFDTLSTRLWSHVSSLSYAAAAPYAVTIVALAAVPTALLSTLGDRRSRT
jgi:iron(III) transport system permease protein